MIAHAHLHWFTYVCNTLLLVNEIKYQLVNNGSWTKTS